MGAAPSPLSRESWATKNGSSDSLRLGSAAAHHPTTPACAYSLDHDAAGRVAQDELRYERRREGQAGQGGRPELGRPIGVLHNF